MTAPTNAPTNVPTFRRLIASVAALLLTAALCEPGADIVIDNQTDQVIVIAFTGGTGEEVVRHEIQPGQKAFDRDECLEQDLYARTNDGTIVARRSAPFCQGDPPWVITDEATS